MLTLIYIDNLRCFMNFDYTPEKKQLLPGANGSGKSSLFNAIRDLRKFVKGDANPFTQSTRTRWQDRPLQVFEIEALLRFRGILQGRDPAKLGSWLDDTHRSGLYEVRGFANTIRHDLAAFRNTFGKRWSKRQIEGHINRLNLKTLKGRMYGRAGTELLRARLLPRSGNDQPTN